MRRILTPLLCLGLGLPLTACAYRFTNKHVKRPEGIRTIAVEAVYDTSREVIPHEYLWAALQDAFAADGHLQLVSQSSADALVRAHIKQVTIAATGDPSVRDPATKEPSEIVHPDNTVEDPAKFRQLNQASELRETSLLTAFVEIEVWSLRTRTLLMRRNYPLSGTFKAWRGSKYTSIDNNWLRYQESADITFAKLARGAADQVVKDLLIP